MVKKLSWRIKFLHAQNCRNNLRVHCNGPKSLWAEGCRKSHTCFIASVHIRPPSGRRAHSDPHGPDIRFYVSCHGFLQVVTNWNFYKEGHRTGKLLPTNGPGDTARKLSFMYRRSNLVFVCPYSWIRNPVWKLWKRKRDKGELTRDLVNTSQKWIYFYFQTKSICNRE